MTTIRRLSTRADAALWKALSLEAINANPDAFVTTPETEAALPSEKFETDLAGGKRVFVAGRHDGLAVLSMTNDVATLSSVYVRPALRGQGVGDALLDTALAAALAAGCVRVQLWVFSDNVPAIALYRRHGFRLHARAPFDHREDWTMIRDLDDPVPTLPAGGGRGV